MVAVKEEFSVLMSLYAREKVNYFEECMESIVGQTVLPAEIVLVLDGPIPKDLSNSVERYCQKYPELLRIVPLPHNLGLGLALAEGVKACRFELIARMDTDDISRCDRFEAQLREFAADPNLDICGSHIYEFEGDRENVVAQRRVPLTNSDIRKYQKRRDGFNHPSVMYKKSSVLGAGNYRSALLMEDSLLWANMMVAGAKCKNIDDYLVYARIGEDFYERRGGWSYFLKYRQGRRAIRETGFIKSLDYYYTLAVQLCVACMPGKVRGVVFKRLLHRR